jgi:O-antigen/teichoic acid export membrane protein
VNQSRASSQLLRNSLSTYGRLLGTFAIGLFLTRFLGRSDHMGLAGFGLFALLMSSVGLINILQATVRGSLVRELSRAFHSEDPDEMQRGFTAALVACLLVAGGLSALMLVGTPVALRIFQFGPKFADQMFLSWLTLSVYTGWVVITVPFITLFDATHRIPYRNLDLFLERLASLVAALIVFSLPIGHAYPLFGFILADCIVGGLVRLGCAIWANTTCPIVIKNFLPSKGRRFRECYITGTLDGSC